MIAQAAGAVALGTTSSGHAYSLARRDARGALGRDESIEQVRQICAAVDVPVVTKEPDSVQPLHVTGAVEAMPGFAAARRCEEADLVVVPQRPHAQAGRCGQRTNSSISNRYLVVSHGLTVRPSPARDARKRIRSLPQNSTLSRSPKRLWRSLARKLVIELIRRPRIVMTTIPVGWPIDPPGVE